MYSQADIESEMNSIFLEFISKKTNSLSLDTKIRLVDITNTEVGQLTSYMQYLFKRIMLYEKSENVAGNSVLNSNQWGLPYCFKKIYTFVSEVFKHLTHTEEIEGEHLQQMLWELLDYLIQVSLKGVKAKYVIRSIKLINLLLYQTGRDLITKLFSEFQELRDELIKLCINMLKSRSERLWMVTYELWRNSICHQMSEVSPKLILVFDDIFFEQAMSSDKASVRERSLKILHLSKAKLDKIHQLWYDKDANVRVALYKKLNRQDRLLRITTGKLFRFLTRGFNEIDPKAKQAFYELLISFLVLPSKEEKEESKEDMSCDKKEEPKVVSFDYDYKYEGSRKRKVIMSFFDLFSKLKIHKTHYIDGFSLLPQKFLGFLYAVFERTDIIKCMEEVFQKIINVLVHRTKNESVSFAHFSFIRLSVDYTKIFLQKDMESYEWLENLIPDIDDYCTVFSYFSTKSKLRREELEILSEWSKYAINLTYTIPSIHERIKDLMLNYISEPDPSINHYTKMIDNALEQEREYEAEMEDIEFCNTDHRDFKNIYLRKRTIGNLCKPVTCNAFIWDPDDVWVIMVTVLFQISLNNVSDFISSIKEAIRTVREDLDKEVDEEEVEDQVDFSIPQRKLISQKKLEKLAEKVARLLSVKKSSSNFSNAELSKIENEYESSVHTIQTVKKELENWCLHEKIINRRTLKIIQILCQLTVKNGLDDETMTWAANVIIEHIKNRDSENMDLCLSCIVDILLFDKDLSASFLKIYQSLLYLSDVSSKNITDENPKSAQIVTIIKSLYDMFWILENFGLDAFQDHSIVDEEESKEEENNLDDNDIVRLQLSNQLLSTLINKFLFCWNIYIRNLWSEGLIKILFERKIGNPCLELFPSNSKSILKNESLYW